MFRNVPECSEMFHVPGFIDALLLTVFVAYRANTLSTSLRPVDVAERRKRLEVTGNHSFWL